MVSLIQIVCITGLVIVSFVIYTQQEALDMSPSDQEFHLNKRHARTSIPLFRGSNLGIFVRKRPHAAVMPEHSMVRRKESHNDEHIMAEKFNNNEQYQRRFDDYSENPGPMFGR